MTQRSSQQRGQRGYTLVELAAVLAIVGIMALIAIPRMSRTQDASQSKQLAANIAKTLDLARVRALSARRSYTLTLAPTDIRLTYVDDAGVTQVEERIKPTEQVRVWVVSNVLLDTAPSAPDSTTHTIRFTSSSLVDLDNGAGVNAYIYVGPVNAAGTGGNGSSGRYLVSVIATGLVQLVDTW